VGLKLVNVRLFPVDSKEKRRYSNGLKCDIKHFYGYIMVCIEITGEQEALLSK
jgi:hypothetical protein